MGSILIAMSKYEDASKIASLIKSRGLPHDVSVCETGAEVLRIANERDFGVVICTKRLKDMSYTEVAQLLPNYFGTIILTKDASIEITNDSMVKLQLPFKPMDLFNTIEMSVQGFKKTLKKKKPPQRSEEEKKLIDQAKQILMVRNELSEEEAFRFIQKNSMDYGRKMIESAQMILALYGD